MSKVLEEENANLVAPKPIGLATSNKQSINAIRLVLDMADSISPNNFNIESGSLVSIEWQ